MLNIYFGDLEKSVYNTSVYFNNTYEQEWLEDDLVKRMIEDVDKSIVLAPECIKSPVLGQIAPTALSGGVKTLILILKEPLKVFNASQCGDNCAKWILEIADRQNITINLRHLMNFGKSEFTAYIVNTDETIHTMSEMTGIAHSLLK